VVSRWLRMMVRIRRAGDSRQDGCCVGAASDASKDGCSVGATGDASKDRIGFGVVFDACEDGFGFGVVLAWAGKSFCFCFRDGYCDVGWCWAAAMVMVIGSRGRVDCVSGRLDGCVRAGKVFGRQPG